MCLCSFCGGKHALEEEIRSFPEGHEVCMYSSGHSTYLKNKKRRKCHISRGAVIDKREGCEEAHIFYHRCQIRATKGCFSGFWAAPDAMVVSI